MDYELDYLAYVYPLPTPINQGVFTTLADKDPDRG